MFPFTWNYLHIGSNCEHTRFNSCYFVFCVTSTSGQDRNKLCTFFTVCFWSEIPFSCCYIITVSLNYDCLSSTVGPHVFSIWKKWNFVNLWKMAGKPFNDFSSVPEKLSGLRNFYRIYHWITSLLFFQAETSFEIDLYHKFAISHCGLEKSQIQTESGNALKNPSNTGDWDAKFSSGVNTYVMKWHCENQESFTEHVWSVQIPNIKAYKLQENL